MTISIIPGGFDQRNPEFGQQKAGLDEGWIKALEKAHFEEQRDSMTSASSGHVDLPSSDTVYGVDARTNKVSFTGEESSAKNLAPRAQEIVTSGTVLPPETVSEAHSPTVIDPKPFDSDTCQRVNIQTNAPVKSIRSQDSSGSQGSFRALRIERLVPGSVFPTLSVNMLPSDSGVELVIRSQIEAGSRLASTIKEVRALLAESNQKLASIRVNGEVVSTFATEPDDEVSTASQKPDKVNRTY